MQIYSGAGLENFDPEDLEGAVYDIISIVGSLRQSHSDLWQIFAPSRISTMKKNIKYGWKMRASGNFYKVLSKFGRYLGIALESEQIYNALPAESCKGIRRP